jgi:putative Holliday junction resolvase
VRVVALDLGARRIGVAACDSGGTLARPEEVIERSGERARDHEALAAAVTRLGAELVVVGLPLSLSGRRGAAATAAEEEAAALAATLEVPVETFDERLTTVEAARRRRERAELAGRPRARKRQGRGGIDAEAAAVLLEAWLARRRARAGA